MTIVDFPFRCNICQKRREADTNHWYLVKFPPLTRQDGGFEFGEIALVVTTWDSLEALAFGREHICGIKCLTIRVERWSQETVARATERAQAHASDLGAHNEKPV